MMRLYDLKNGDFFKTSSVTFVEKESPGKDVFSKLEELLVYEEDAYSDDKNIVSEASESEEDDYEKVQKSAEDEMVDDGEGKK
jgi:hypothetical protein